MLQPEKSLHLLHFPLKKMSHQSSIFKDKTKGILEKKYEPIFLPIIDKQLAVNTYYQNDLIAAAGTRISISLLIIFDTLKINFKVNINEISVEQRETAFQSALTEIIDRQQDFFEQIDTTDIPVIQDSASTFIRQTIDRKLSSPAASTMSDHFTEIRGYLEFANSTVTTEQKYIGVAAALKQMVETERSSYNLGKNHTGETLAHIIKTTWFSLALAKELGFFTQKDYKALSVICMGHDVGKALMPKDIIYKTSRLTQMENDIMKSHVLFSYLISSRNQQDLNFESFAMALHHIKENKLAPDSYSITKDTATSFHEFLTNEAKKKLEHIYQYTRPFYRIMSIADAFEAISAERVYKKPSSIGKTLDIMIRSQEEHHCYYQPYFETFIQYILKTFLPRNLGFNITDPVLTHFIEQQKEKVLTPDDIKAHFKGVVTDTCRSLSRPLQCLLYDTRKRKIEVKIMLPPNLFLNQMYFK